MEESVQDLTEKIPQQKKGMTTTYVENTVGSFKSLWEDRPVGPYFHRILPITESTKLDNMLNNINYKRK